MSTRIIDWQGKRWAVGLRWRTEGVASSRQHLVQEGSVLSASHVALRFPRQTDDGEVFDGGYGSIERHVTAWSLGAALASSLKSITQNQGVVVVCTLSDSMELLLVILPGGSISPEVGAERLDEPSVIESECRNWCAVSGFNVLRLTSLELTELLRGDVELAALTPLTSVSAQSIMAGWLIFLLTVGGGWFAWHSIHLGRKPEIKTGITVLSPPIVANDVPPTPPSAVLARCQRAIESVPRVAVGAWLSDGVRCAPPLLSLKWRGGIDIRRRPSGVLSDDLSWVTTQNSLPVDDLPSMSKPGVRPSMDDSGEGVSTEQALTAVFRRIARSISLDNADGVKHWRAEVDIPPWSIPLDIPHVTLTAISVQPSGIYTLEGVLTPSIANHHAPVSIQQ